MKKPSRGLIGYIVLIAAFILMAVLLSGGKSTGGEITYPDLLKNVQDGKVEYVAVRGQNLYGLYYDSVRSYAEFPDSYDFYCVIGSDFLDTLRTMAAADAGVDRAMISEGNLVFSGKSLDIIYLAPLTTPWILEWLPFILMIGLMLFFWWFLMRQQMGGNGKVMNFGRSRAQMSDPSKNKIRFADVAGAVEEKEELKELVDFLRNPRTYLALGARIPKGVLLVGPPGTGKTLLAKAVAGEADVPFFSISGSDFVEMFVGVGASRVRDLFEQAKRNSPSIVFIDEIDAVGRHRGAGLGGGHDEREQTLNQLLVEMDGFAANEGVIVMAATNRRDILDPALLRPGRFDRQITVNYPDVDGRVEILKVHSRGKPLAADVDLENIAKRTPFATGADLENIMNEAAIRAARARKTQIDQSMLIEAVERVQMGPEKKSHKVLEEDRKLVAYHEAGHAIVGHFLPLCDEVHTVTIVPRGGAGGFTLSLPSKELDNMSRNQLLQRTSMMLGGHAAERLIFHDVYTGAQSDLQHATSTCRAMVTRFGMSDKIGTIYLDSDQEVFVGASFGHSREYSEELAAKVDAEVSELLKSCYQTAMDTLTQHQDKLNGLAELLIERETLSRGEFVAFMEGRPLPEKSKGEPAQEQTQQAETAEPAAAENTPNE
ncbi:MAG: ATP-dependent zinc metalloprotease FtsH [Clostridiales bacterium]|nr:ATP-dependent zinc metalloprotease FtsH [Clostridiales bacterium]MDY5469218.1 ATP-dependent zinc metalloprotease FtsH [Eubacteriales bacterium]